MKAKLISLALLTALTVGQSAFGSTMFFNPDSQSAASGSIDVVLPIDKLSSVPVPRGRIILNGNLAEVSMIPEWQFDRDIVLYGKVLDTRIVMAGKQPVARGVILFTDGAWIDYFDDHRQDEVVVTGKGSVTGRIAEVTNTEITLEAGTTTQKIFLADVLDVRSPRVFTFIIPTTPLQQPAPGQPFYSDARSITMTPTSRPFRIASLRRTVSKQMDDGDLSTAQLIGIGTALSLVEFGQLVPTFAVPLGATGGYERQLFNRSLPFVTGAK